MRPKLPALLLVLTLSAAQEPQPARAPAGHAAPRAPLRFRITLVPEAASKPVSGRLLVFMSSSETGELLSTEFEPGAWVAAREFESIAPGQTVDLDPDVDAFPEPFSKARPGAYRIQPLLDADHSYPYSGPNDTDIYGPVEKVSDLDPANAGPIELKLDKADTGRAKPADTDLIRRVVFSSKLLSRFWGRTIMMRAGLVLPPGFAKSPGRRYPAAYIGHGFGGDYRDAWREGPRLIRKMRDGKAVEMAHVFLDGSFPTGDHEFADSVNNGPWGRALTTEFIPYLEKTYRLIPEARARFLTGHSSGGWMSLWLQVTYPDLFGGTWSTAPDPVDFRKFITINVTPGSTDNVYRWPDGRPRNLVRENGRDRISMEAFSRNEQVLGEYGGQMASFEWVFSPKAEDGRPLKLFNRVTGVLDPTAAQAWQKYDIRRNLATNWSTLGPKLRGKLNVICGAQDTFHLEEAVALLCEFLKSKGSDAVCEIVPGRDHMNLYAPYKTYPNGLADRIQKEMEKKFSGR